MSSTGRKPIIFYDIPSIVPGRSWSPNTMKTKYTLGYKQLPYTTVWIELPDIAGLLQSKGITTPPYTLPAIEDPNTSAFVVESAAIATYLDETYPDTPKVLTPASRAALEGMGDVFSFGSAKLSRNSSNANTNANDGVRNFAPRLVFLILASEHLNSASKEYYHRTRGDSIGEPWAELANACSASAEERAVRVERGVAAIRAVWHKAAALYPHSKSSDLGVGHRFALGDEPCFLDFVVAGRAKFALNALTEAEAEALKALDDGRLVQLVEDLERYL